MRYRWYRPWFPSAPSSADSRLPSLTRSKELAPRYRPTGFPSVASLYSRLQTTGGATIANVVFSTFLIALAPLPQPSGTPCHPGTARQIVVRIEGFRTRSGNVRVRLFGDPPASYFDKRKTVVRIEMPIPQSGPVEICVRAPRPGLYAIDVRHDVNVNGKTDRQDGGGASGNPRISLLDMLFARKPAAKSVQFAVQSGTTIVPVTLMYLQGGVFRPAASAR